MDLNDNHAWRDEWAQEQRWIALNDDPDALYEYLVEQLSKSRGKGLGRMIMTEDYDYDLTLGEIMITALTDEAEAGRMAKQKFKDIVGNAAFYMAYKCNQHRREQLLNTYLES